MRSSRRRFFRSSPSAPTPSKGRWPRGRQGAAARAASPCRPRRRRRRSGSASATDRGPSPGRAASRTCPRSRGCEKPRDSWVSRPRPSSSARIPRSGSDQASLPPRSSPKPGLRVAAVMAHADLDMRHERARAQRRADPGPFQPEPQAPSRRPSEEGSTVTVQERLLGLSMRCTRGASRSPSWRMSSVSSLSVR